MAKRGTIFGFGVNDSSYPVKVSGTKLNSHGTESYGIIWTCPYYERWHSILRRAYSAKYHKKYPSYISCSVSDSWRYFSNFRVWMQEQDWEGKHLDKDILFPGNKVYSPQTCVFVDPRINLFILDREGGRGVYPIGVTKNAMCSTYKARCQNPFTSKRESLGNYSNPTDAHNAWLKKN